MLSLEFSIAEVKEEMKSSRERGNRKRKVVAPPHLKVFIRKAIQNLGPNATYKEIQGKALKIYQEQVTGKIENFYGIFETQDTLFLSKIAQDKGIYYGIKTAYFSGYR